jgi:hypothetical protein
MSMVSNAGINARSEVKARAENSQCHRDYQLVAILRTIDESLGFEQQLYRVLDLESHISGASKRNAINLVRGLKESRAELDHLNLVLSETVESLTALVKQQASELEGITSSESWKFGWFALAPLRWLRARTRRSSDSLSR